MTAQRKEVCPLALSFASLSWRSPFILFPSCHNLSCLGEHSDLEFRVGVDERAPLGWTPPVGGTVGTAWVG